MTPFIPFYLVFIFSFGKKLENLQKAVRRKDRSWMKAASFELCLLILVLAGIQWFISVRSS